jgi:hypothetical protein
MTGDRKEVSYRWLTSRTVTGLQSVWKGFDSTFSASANIYDDSRPDEGDKDALEVLNWHAQCSASAGSAFASTTDLTMSSRRRPKRSAAVMTES